ncbi:MAG: hypothetical protein PHF60_04840 [Candidatus ainarchaeum sp.]|nr:hypothetical protein [Candidatus ainarchaeum sp.]
MDLRYLFVFLILSQLAVPLFADCIGYTDSFDVRVLDAKLRPIEGAVVTVTFDRGTSFGEQYFTTSPRYTDSQGKLHYDILNQGTTTRQIDCDITITGSAGGSTKTAVVEANIHGSPVDIILTDVYPMKFFVWDQLNAPLENASVTLGGKMNKTDSTGMVKYYFKTGDYSYFASYLDAEQAGSLTVANDTDYVVIFAHYTISIDVMDDTSAPLSVTLRIFNQTFDVPDGHFEYTPAFGEQIPYSVDYRGIVREGTLMPASEPSVTVIFDTHAPSFGDIVPGEISGKPQLSISVTDPNAHASGLDLSSIEVLYKIEPSDETTPWSKAVTFTSGRNTFTAQFPELPSKSIVKVKIGVKDKEGNRAEIDLQFSTLDVQPPQNGTQDQNNTQESPVETQGIPFSYILGGVILLVLVVYMVFRLKPKPKEGA